jgi:hypothetical protein
MDAETETRTLPNGALQDVKTGKIVKAAPGGLFDSKKGRDAALKRAENMRRKTREGVLKAVQKKNNGKEIRSFVEAHGEVVETLIDEVVLNKDEMGAVRTSTYKTILEIEGSLGKMGKGMPELGEGEGARITLSETAAQHLINVLARSKAKEAPQVIDGEFSIVEG